MDFPDLMSCVENEEEIIPEAQDLLGLTIIDYIDRNMELPQSTKNLKDSIYIQVWLPYYRSKVKEIYVKKTLTIPSWLDLLAKEKNINFSATLVKGLKEELGIK
ncbi:MAG: type II toxin-antitoxin system HicB family antitoxin [Lachnospirales bacterium]